MDSQKYNEIIDQVEAIIKQYRDEDITPSSEFEDALDSVFENLGKVVISNEEEAPADISKEEFNYLSLLKMQVEWDNSAEGHLEDGFDCDECKNKGVIYRIKGNQEVVSPCVCVPKRELLRVLRNNNLSDEKNSLKTFKRNNAWQSYMYNSAMEYLKFPRSWFYVGGIAGSGKTRLCSGIVYELLRQSAKVKFMMWRDEANKLKQHRNDSDEFDRLMEPLKKSPYLYIDDFLKTIKGEPPTPADLLLAYEILNYRYSNNLPTIFSSELSLDELQDYDTALAGRIKEMCYQKEKCFDIEVGKDIEKDQRQNMGGLLLS